MGGNERDGVLEPVCLRRVALSHSRFPCASVSHLYIGCDNLRHPSLLGEYLVVYKATLLFPRSLLLQMKS